MFWATCFVLHTSGTIYSLNLYINSLKYMFCGKDTKYKAAAVQGDTGLISEEGKQVEDRTIIFIRHGESTWNETFNPGTRPRAPLPLSFALRQPVVLRWGLTLVLSSGAGVW